MKISALFLSLFLMLNTAQAQFHQSLYPELEGEELLEALRDYFSNNNAPASAFARDVMFGDIYKEDNGQVICVYTGFTIDLPAGDPSSEAFALGLNTEHTMPRSFLEGSGGDYDIHNLYPTRVEVNSDRSNFPFGEIADNQTDKWYYLDQQQGNVPGDNIDLYSEQINGRFEPREDHKGNVARAMMYCYALYGTTIEQNAPLFFEQQRETLCNWHVEDPADEAEYERTYRIASYQNDRPNPFVLDCTLASRSFCQDVSAECTLPPLSSSSEIEQAQLRLSAENPFSHSTQINYSVPLSGQVRLTLWSSRGELLQVLRDAPHSPGEHQLEFAVEPVKGLYIVQYEIEQNGKYISAFLKLIHD